MRKLNPILVKANIETEIKVIKVALNEIENNLKRL